MSTLSKRNIGSKFDSVITAVVLKAGKYFSQHKTPVISPAVVFRKKYMLSSLITN